MPHEVSTSRLCSFDICTGFQNICDVGLELRSYLDFQRWDQGTWCVTMQHIHSSVPFYSVGCSARAQALLVCPGEECYCDICKGRSLRQGCHCLSPCHDAASLTAGDRRYNSQQLKLSPTLLTARNSCISCYGSSSSQAAAQRLLQAHW